MQWDDAFGLGLAYMHARHYSPTLGRFLQPDPDGSEANLYAYTANNPVTELDPSGTCFILCAVLNAAIDTAIYLATTDQSEWSLQGTATAAAVGAVTGFLGVGLLSKAAKIGVAAKALTKVPKAGRGLAQACARHSFDGETLVTVADGSQVPISQLAVGDLVLAWDEASGETRTYPVSATWVHDDPITGFVVIAGEAIATTPGHPFYVVDRGWLEAADLVRGDRVPSASGDPGTVEAISWERGPDTMYDLTVAIAHTYLVGAGGWRVHNCDQAARHGNSLDSERVTTLYRALDPVTREFRKFGITSNIQKRYPAGRYILESLKSGTRREVAGVERRMVQRFGGPDNHEPWSRLGRQ